jgi:hypothetical protein
MSFQQKHVHSLPAVERAGRHVKRYHITREPDGVIGADVVDAAYAAADKLLPAPDGEMPPARPWPTSGPPGCGTC